MAGGSPAARPISRCARANRVTLSIISSTSRPLVAKVLGDRRPDVGRPQADQGRFVAGCDHDDAAGQSVRAQILFQKLADFAAPFADQHDDVDVGRAARAI